MLTIGITVVLAITGGWIAGARQQTEQAVRIETVERTLEDFKALQEAENQLATRLTSLEVRSDNGFYQMERIDRQLAGYDERLQQVQITSAETITVIKQFTVVAESLTKHTGRLSDVVSRLDERLKHVENKGD